MIDNKPRDTCACWKEKKVMSKYCITCGRDINILRVLIRTWCKEKSEIAEKKLRELLEFHWQLLPKTKTTKMREKRAKEKEL